MVEDRDTRRIAEAIYYVCRRDPRSGTASVRLDGAVDLAAEIP